MTPEIKKMIIRDAIFVVLGLVIVLSFLNIRIPGPKARGDAQTQLSTGKLTLTDANHSKTITVELAQTDTQQQQGLSFRPLLSEDQGMLFLLSSPGPQRFWMYGMNFPLDIIFIRNGRVVDYEENVPPPSQTQNSPAIVTTLEETDAVLEVNAGKAKEWGIGVGTEVELEK